MAEEYGRLTIEAERGGTIAEISDYLLSLENAYNNLYAFDLLYVRARQIVYGDRDSQSTIFENVVRYPRASTLKALKPFKNVEGLVLPEDRLRLVSVVIPSPGFWEVIGSFNPLETIRKYLGERHEQRKDREYREPLEAEKLSLENEKLRTEVLRDKVEFMRSMEMPEEQIRQALAEHVIRPLSSMDQYQDSRLIKGASIRKIDYF